jgi:phosphoglycolate phosphatase-like HAD superfamily hydrolase
MIYKSAIFDLDGTLVGTCQGYRNWAVNSTLWAIGVPCVTEDLVDKFWYEPDRNKTVRECFEAEPKEFWKIYVTFDTPERRVKATRPYDDVDFLKELRERGYKVGIVTGSPSKIAAAEISLLPPVDAVVVAHSTNGFRHKPDRQDIDACLRELMAKREGSFFVGNGPEDMGAAKAADVAFYMIGRGEYDFDGFKPDIESLYDIRKYL